MPLLVDGNFDRTVVLVLNHDDSGAVGVVLNRPTTTAVADPLPRWEDLAAEPAVVFVGGPVEQDAAIALARDGDVIGTIDLDGDPALLTARQVRVYVGYAGWSSGQLEGEIGEGAWHVVDSELDDAFRPDAADLWHIVLRRQPGPIARLGMLPDDPSVN